MTLFCLLLFTPPAEHHLLEIPLLEIPLLVQINPLCIISWGEKWN